MVVTRSSPINFPVCRPTGELNSSKCFLSSHCESLSGGESMKQMLNDVNGRRFRVDQPSQTVDTFDEMRYHLLVQKMEETDGTHVDDP
jgi:hypothetical protein